MTTTSSYPREEGDVVVLGPEIFASKDGLVISWKGENYVPQVATAGAGLIAAERARQVFAEGYSPEHDDMHTGGEIAWAAVCYAAPGRVYVERHGTDRVAFVDPWPWPAHSDLSGRGYYDGDKRKAQANYVRDVLTDPAIDRLDLLVKAGALIAAELDRLQRAARASR